MGVVNSTEEYSSYWQAAEAYQRRLLELCEPPAGQPLDQPAIAAAAKELPQLLQTLRSAQGSDEALRRQNAYLAALHETTLDLASQLDLNRLLESIVRRAGQLMGTDSGYLDLIEPDTDQLMPNVGLGALAESLDHPMRRGAGMAGQVWETGQPVVIDDYDRWPGRFSTFNRQKVRAAVGVPLLSGARVMGVLGLAYQANSERKFGPEAVEVLNQFARLAVVAIENARLYTAAQKELAERQRAEAALKEVEATLEKRLMALTRPLGDTSDLHFDDLFNREEVQRIQDAFAEATAVSSIITDTQGQPLTRPSNFCRLCQDVIRKTEKGRVNCFASDAAFGWLDDAGPTIQPCLSAGLWNSGASIYVGDRPVAHWHIGQVLDYDADEAALLSYGREIGADENEFRQALAEVPRMSEAQFAKITRALFVITQQLSVQALQNIQQAREITQRKQAADTLRASEARYRDLFENSPIPLWEEDFSEVKTYLEGLRRQGVTDLEAYLAANPEAVDGAMRLIKVRDVNQAALKLYGAPTKETLLGNLDRVLGPLTYPVIVDELQAIDRGVPEFEAFGVNRTLTGDIIDVALRWFIPDSQEHDLARLIVSTEDVTQQRRAEVALRESEARFRAYIEHAPEGIFVADTAGRYLDANEAACEMVGYSRDELLSLGIQELVPPGDTWQTAGFGALLATGAFSGEVRLKRKDGTVVPIILNAVTLPNGTLLAFCTDITERQRADEKLRASEERYRVLAEALPDLVYILDRQHRVQYLNALAARALRRRPDEAVGLLQSDLFPADTARDQDAHVEQVFATGQPLNSESRLPLPGSEIWIDNRLTPLRDASGEIVAVLGVSRDVTERKAMEQALHEERASLARRVSERTAELNAANAELVRAMRAKDDFLATMSHELRTPLTGILGLSESLEMGIYGSLSDKQVRSLQMIHASGEHLLALIGDVLDLAKIGAEKLELNLQWVSAVEVCQASLRLINPQAGKKNIHVASRFDSAVKGIRADARRLKQMLVNLLGNAVKFTPEAGAIGLELTGDAEGQRVLFTVWDTGIGISAADLQRLFQPFMQVDSSLSRRYEGAGLGLALVRRLAELHGGGVIAESREGQGSRFTIALPWHPAERIGATEAAASGAVEPPLPNPSLSPPAATSQALPELILLAEDNELLVSAIVDTLQAQGYEVAAARDGLEALAVAKKRRPALILMDIQMPGLDGLETIRRLRAEPGLLQTPVIALTARTMPGDRERCLAAGANDYMSKPVKWAELLEKMRDLLKA